MPKKAIINYMFSADLNRKVQLQLMIQCAPFLKKLKKACILTLDKKSFKEVKKLVKGTNISAFVLYENMDKTVIFLYRKEEFQKYLEEKEIQKFLKNFNYKKFELYSLLKVLSQRASDYYSEKKEFPHELGIFLGYPLEDVNGFIENKGENFLMSGYWKVYQNVSKAQKTFKEYDNARENAVIELLSGKSFTEIIG